MHKQLYVSSRVVIAKLQRDLKPKDTGYVADALTWMGEAIGHIGCYNSRQEVELPITVVDYKAGMPCSVDNFLWLKYNGKRLTLNPRMQSRSDLSKNTQVLAHPSEYYSYTDKYFTFTFQTGEVSLYHMGIPRDCEYPKIPDNESYKEACVFYIINRMIMGGFVHSISTFTFDYTWARFEHFAQRARNEVDAPTIADMDTFIHEWCSPFTGVDFMNKTTGVKTFARDIKGDNDLSNPFAINDLTQL